jgi:hypothetical protein
MLISDMWILGPTANAAAMVSGDQVVAKSTFWKPVY